ncbi:MAG: hypothetical protein NTY25_01900 [Planctomycetia bacterium]|nr:hypothetical protein [Planctomycetia bacterium]
MRAAIGYVRIVVTTYGVTTSWLSSLTSEDVLERLQWPLLAI